MFQQKAIVLLSLLLPGVFLAAGLAAQAQQGLGTTVTPPLTGTPTLSPIPPTTAVPQYHQTFDPYSTQPAASSAPSLLSPPTTTTAPGTPQPYTFGQPPSTYGATAPAAPTYGYQQPPPGFGTSAPPVMFPQGLYGQPQAAAPTSFGNPLKLFQNVRLSYAWLEGKDGDELDINDIYLTTTAAFPNFLWSGFPWYVSPGFGLHLWSGPYPIAGDPQLPPGLPPRAYDAFLDLGWQSDPDQTFGVELSGRLGVYSDFGKVEQESFRPKGVALMRLNLTPTIAIKAGVDYINRADIKLLPAGGVLWTPNPQTRFDIYFPQPKLATYLTTLGNNEMWWYLGGEYGGGAWTANVLLDSDGNGTYENEVYTLMDINDYRVFLGIELHRSGSSGIGQPRMFFEAGYVWNREVVLVAAPADSFSVSDTFMLRGGFAF